MRLHRALYLTRLTKLPSDAYDGATRDRQYRRRPYRLINSLRHTHTRVGGRELAREWRVETD